MLAHLADGVDIEVAAKCEPADTVRRVDEGIVRLTPRRITVEAGLPGSNDAQRAVIPEAVVRAGLSAEEVVLGVEGGHVRTDAEKIAGDVHLFVELDPARTRQPGEPAAGSETAQIELGAVEPGVVRDLRGPGVRPPPKRGHVGKAQTCDVLIEVTACDDCVSKKRTSIALKRSKPPTRRTAETSAPAA